jgi:hypothetical protein
MNRFLHHAFNPFAFAMTFLTIRGQSIRAPFTRSILLPSILMGLLISSAPAEVLPTLNPAAWEKSIVLLDVTRTHYDYNQPWSKRAQNSPKIGVVLDEQRILTTANQLFDRTLVRIQKMGRGQWWVGEVEWIDYHANLALITCKDERLWQDLTPAALSRPSLPRPEMQIARWREGKLEFRKTEFNQFTVSNGALSFVPSLQMEVSCEMSGLGNGEPLIAGAELLGIVVHQAGNTCAIIPSHFIHNILEAKSNGSWKGLGYFPFQWQTSVNPANVGRLKLEGDPRGVIILGSSPAKEEKILRPNDILLEIDGFAIDSEGDYRDPDYGFLSLENLATREKMAGDELQMVIWRDGQRQEIAYPLPKADYSDFLLPEAHYDQEPEYLIIGGLIFQPLTIPYLQTWGNDWKRRAPFRLAHFAHESPSKERPALVLLSQVLPDMYNIGYQELRYLVLEEVNGRKIRRLQDLKEALEEPNGDVHSFNFMEGDNLRKIVLCAREAEAATQRVLKHYGIARDYFLSSAPEPVTLSITE